MNYLDRAVISGVGETRYGVVATQSLLGLELEASLNAIRDAGLSPHDIDGMVAYPSASTAEELCTSLGIEDLRFSASTPLGGAAPVAAIQCAIAAIASGICDHVLVSLAITARSGVRIGARLNIFPQMRVVGEFERPSGAVAPALLYAPMARRHMEAYGTTSRQFAEIAVATRAHAILHGNATFKTPITIDDHQNSRMIADPFRLLDCSLESDGGAAVVVSRADAVPARAGGHVRVIGIGEGHPSRPTSITQRDDLTRLGIAKVAPRVFSMAGVKHSDIDVAEIYDCFTYMVLCQLEDMGFCAKGEGGDFVSRGNIGLGGSLPVNTHGGLLSQAHMVGMNHVVELVRQLRGEAGAAQVANARTGLVTGYGDNGDGALAIMARG